MSQIIVVFLGSGIGGSLRYILSNLLGPFSSAFPLNTLLINISGSLLIGVLANKSLSFGLSDNLRLLLITGVLGGYTTFSAFSLETLNLIENGQITSALLYILLVIIFSLLGCFIGSRIMP